MTVKRKYIDSHWLVFAVQGALAILFGWCMIFSGVSALSTLVVFTSFILLCFGVIELVNLVQRTHQKETWGFSLAMAVLEVAAGLGLLFTLSRSISYHITIISVYTVLRSILEILIGLHSIDDLTDRFIWILCGICGAVLGVVILNSGRNMPNEFIRAFGVYMITFGLCNMIYGVHNRDQRLEYRDEHRRLSRKKSSSRKSTK